MYNHYTWLKRYVTIQNLNFHQNSSGLFKQTTSQRQSILVYVNFLMNQRRVNGFELWMGSLLQILFHSNHVWCFWDFFFLNFFCSFYSIFVFPILGCLRFYFSIFLSVFQWNSFIRIRLGSDFFCFYTQLIRYYIVKNGEELSLLHIS